MTTRPITEAELKRLADLGNRELAAREVTDRRWVIDPNWHLNCESFGEYASRCHAGGQYGQGNQG